MGESHLSRHGVRDGHARQAGAAIERTAADAVHLVRAGNARQAGARLERPFADARNVVRKGLKKA